MLDANFEAHARSSILLEEREASVFHVGFSYLVITGLCIFMHSMEDSNVKMMHAEIHP